MGVDFSEGTFTTVSMKTCKYGICTVTVTITKEVKKMEKNICDDCKIAGCVKLKEDIELCEVEATRRSHTDTDKVNHVACKR